MLVQAFSARGLSYDVIDLSPRDTSRPDGSFSLGRAFSFAGPFLRAARLLLLGRRRTVYLLLAQSWPGFLRDAVFIGLSCVRGQRLVTHLKGGGYADFYAGLPAWKQRAVASVLSRASAILVLSGSFREHFSFVPGYEEKVEVVFNGLPFPEARLPALGKRLPEAGQPVRILYLSNLVESKGYLELLEAVRILVRERGLDVECRFCGEFLLSSDEQRYATPAEAHDDFFDRVSRADLQDHVRWAGRAGGDEKLDALAEAHIFVLPTRYRNEGQPVSIIEALASGCAVVATRHRGIPEMLSEGAAGVLLDSIKPESIADAVEALVADSEAFAALSRASVERYRDAFRQSAHLERILPLILGGPADAAGPQRAAGSEGS